MEALDAIFYAVACLPWVILGIAVAIVLGVLLYIQTFGTDPAPLFVFLVIWAVGNQLWKARRRK